MLSFNNNKKIFNNFLIQIYQYFCLIKVIIDYIYIYYWINFFKIHQMSIFNSQYKEKTPNSSRINNKN